MFKQTPEYQSCNQILYFTVREVMQIATVSMITVHRNYIGLDKKMTIPAPHLALFCGTYRFMGSRSLDQPLVQ